MSSFLIYSSTISIYLPSCYAILAYYFSLFDFNLLHSSIKFSLFLYFCISSSRSWALIISSSLSCISCDVFLAASIISWMSSQSACIYLFLAMRSFSGPSAFSDLPEESLKTFVISLKELTNPLIDYIIYLFVACKQSSDLIGSFFSYWSSFSGLFSLFGAS